MFTRTMIGAAALGTAALLLSGCGGGSSASMPPTMPSPTQVQQVDTQQLLVVAKAPSETSDPRAVGNKVLVVADADDETSDPMPVG